MSIHSLISSVIVPFASDARADVNGEKKKKAENMLRSYVFKRSGSTVMQTETLFSQSLGINILDIMVATDVWML